MPGVSERNWLILTALAMEAKAIAAEFGTAPHDLQIIGIRASRLDRNALAQYQKILLAGLAGALDPTLNIGDIVAFPPSPGIPGEGWGEGLTVRPGKIHATDHVISSPEEKQTLFRQTGCLAVDMESDIVSQAAAEANLPFIHIRAISDTAADALPPNLSAWIDDLGNPRLPRLATDLALHPNQIPAMIRLGKNSRLAVRNLARAVRQIVQLP
jgi:adenosylhomocysteine nucleosidase